MATDKTATASMAGSTLQPPKPDLLRTTSSTSLDTAVSSNSLSSDLSTSTAKTTPHHSRSGTRSHESKPSAASLDGLSDYLLQSLEVESKKSLGTGLPVPRNAPPSEMPATKKNARDPWTLSYPAPDGVVDVAACLAKKKLAGSPYERLQEARRGMTREKGEKYDSKQRTDQNERMRSWEHQQFEDTMKNLTRKFGHAAAFNNADKITRPHTFQN